MITIIAFIFVFGLIVFFHEFGHFLFAKLSGIMVKDFSIGFGPKIFAYRKKETQYTIRLLPIGGFVRMAGEDGESLELKPGTRVGLELSPDEKVTKIIVSGRDQYVNAQPLEVSASDLQKNLFIEGYEDYDETKLVRYSIQADATLIDGKLEEQIVPYERTFGAKSLGKRAITIFAGPLFNFVLSVLIFTILAFAQGGVVKQDNELGKITPKSPAAAAGLKQGDKVLAIDGKKTKDWQAVVTEIAKHPDKQVAFDIKRSGNDQTIAVTPEKVKADGKEIGRIGAEVPIDHSFGAKITHGVTQTIFWIKQIFTILGNMITGGFSLNMLNGPVGIYTSTQQVVHYGFLTVLNWTAALSINLGIVNLLPLPALDGGRLLFFLYELIRRKPVDPKKEGIIHFVGFALLMILMILVTWNDIQRAFF
ncbi:Zinc metalloprotease rasP [Listeria grayi]|uniref:Zinc metalloprotease n=2 Tax=Listeria grayi TaxID=1641 RepID=D7V054_LISGR|nr:RIP metalloprotease RseP [Listeria grayi]EFI83807.1 RIP metalloprotease RseP [Listeria grayi DSM 20601]EUJ30091.1 membrane-associated zinc metalloprotease [Listeria grayi FSL F6-1183]MBC1923156.1 RIP metalloprotease RseP [Listeria grayi]VEI33821.1 Zinc metalloprotease rasP [Listeria grayi]